MRAAPGQLALTKHHGAGNDFLVYVDPEDRQPLTAALAQALCHRHRGVGADGLIKVGRPPRGAGPQGISMELRNADGSPAEMSGNGIRCAVQAAVGAGMARPPSVAVATGAGWRQVDYRPGPRGAGAEARVDMGPVQLGDAVSLPDPVLRARVAQVGNPHLVAQVPEASAGDLGALAQELSGHFSGERNVELITLGGPDRLEMVVWERGAGLTLACGTGSCAAAAVAQRWGLVHDRVAVANPGGTLEVMLSPLSPGGTATGGAPCDEGLAAALQGPVRQVAEVLVDLAALGVPVPEGAASASGRS